MASPSRVDHRPRHQGYFQHDGQRTVVSQRALQAYADPWLGYTNLNGMGQLVAEASPYTADLEWDDINDMDDILQLLGYLGQAVAKIHCVSDTTATRRWCPSPPTRPSTRSCGPRERVRLLDGGLRRGLRRASSRRLPPVRRRLPQPHAARSIRVEYKRHLDLSPLPVVSCRLSVIIRASTYNGQRTTDNGQRATDNSSQKERNMNTGDTALVLISAALVALMTPGLAFFYGGLVRRKNVLSIMMQSFISMGVVTIIWVLVGFSLAFSGDNSGIIGDFSWVGSARRRLRTRTPAYAPDHPLPGVLPLPGDVRHHHPRADHRRIRRPRQLQELPDVPGALEPAGLRPVRPLGLGRRLPGARWGVVDFAGGMVVHLSAGMAALASVFVVGKRKLAPGEKLAPHNVAFVALGTGLLWFGWFGFNGGSALAANGVAATAFVNTDIAASVAMMTWLFISWAREQSRA